MQEPASPLSPGVGGVGLRVRSVVQSAAGLALVRWVNWSATGDDDAAATLGTGLARRRPLWG